ncbi:TonB-dependent receptor [Luteimonas sp. RD2P54]|uniref:TonB-dependent receptor n=1 Tax=Luteimonas endophytica TaxID=3042023 RepID=A0ABT6JAG2_9GAMM|nr:TonB-dependent receptor [Luteimonas endophytica]MDH5823816.1 TonB-dependent receptor [Luteimonas endophytica]
MKTPLSVAIACALLSAAPLAHSQEPQDAATAPAEEETTTTDLDRMVVTGSRSPRAVDRIPGAVTIVSPEEVQRSLTLTEDATAVLARSVPGYSESSQAMSNLGETLRGRTALRLFDGIPQGSPLREGNRSGTFTDMGVIGRIEVISGPSASEGIGAAGGIINYLSKTPTEEGTVATLTSRYSTQFREDSDAWKVGLTVEHKQDSHDVLAAASFIDRGMAWDADGRRVGMNASGSTNDSEADNLFLKWGMNFGEAGLQRLQASASRFNITGKGNYSWVEGDREQGIPDSAVRTPPLGSMTEFNDFRQYALAYTNADVFGGTLQADVYRASQAMRYPAEDGIDRQDPDIAPIGELIDQSEIATEKKGLRASWTRSEIFAVPGLELRAGVDLVEDEAQQRLAITNRVWVPPMVYESTAPYAQLTWDIGPLTLSGGLRREDGELSVDDYVTTWYRNRVAVQGGTLDYQENLPNFGAIWRIADDWSVYASYGKGFSLPNVGIPLRNINQPGQTVEGFVDLQAIVVDNREVGFNWRGRRGSLGASYYETSSDFGSSLVVDPATEDFILSRVPVDIEGFEASGEWRPSEAWRLTALYSRIRGKTTFGNTGPLSREMGINDISPDKLSGAATWAFNARGDVTLGATMLFDRDINEGTSAEEHTSGYTLFDLSANYDFERYGRLSLGIENLTNKQYILSWSQIDFWKNYFAGRGRMVSLTHTIKF